MKIRPLFQQTEEIEMAFEKLKEKRGGETETVESEVLESSHTPVKSNRPKFRQAFYWVGIVWFLVFLFALCGIWVPVTLVGVAGNFIATAWLLGLLNVVATAVVLVAANEFMDLKE